MLLLICALSTMWVGGAHFRSLAVTMVTIGGGAITAASLLIPYVRSRLQLWFGHAQNPQIESTLTAMAQGGLFGRGLGQGRARNLGVPYLESDYVFAQIGEELGFVGMLLVLGLLLAFLWFSLRLVLSLRNRYEALAAFGLLVSVGLQAMLHVQVVAGLAPPKGMTLPFISDGGTSLIVSSLAVGLALGAARRPFPEKSSCNP
jgi:cell division protein FtsW